jgi:hypothetical protein
MVMQEIRVLARDRGIKAGKLSKVDLVREIQRAEGNFDCFASARDGVCDQIQCLWREDCFDLARKALAA